MGGILLTIFRVDGAKSAEIPPMPRLLAGWDGQLQRNEQYCLPIIVILDTNDIGDAFHQG